MVLPSLRNAPISIQSREYLLEFLGIWGAFLTSFDGTNERKVAERLWY